MKVIVQATIILSICLLVIIMLIAYSPNMVGSNYECVINVDDSSKIEQAISNAVNDVKSRNFIVNNIVVYERYIFLGGSTKTFKIRCSGITKANLLDRD